MTLAILTALAAAIIGLRASWSSPCGESIVTTVHPLAEDARGRSWAPTALTFTLATIITASVLGAALGGVGSLLPISEDVSLFIVAGFLLTGGALDLLGRPPSTTRQLNENWLTTYRGWVIGAGYGAQLGSGFATVVPSWTGYALVPMLLLSGDVLSGAALGIAFGLGRVLAVAPAALIRDRSALLAVPDRWVGAEPVIAMVTSVAVAVIGLIALTGSFSLPAVGLGVIAIVVASVVVGLRSRANRGDVVVS
ncbi:MAG: hypothetical protein GEU79_05360 [Acidimicrobiia bacterium]|nr:hypothetical protein [Acidimicrobiia bacterium]